LIIIVNNIVSKTLTFLHLLSVFLSSIFLLYLPLHLFFFFVSIV